MTRDLFRLKLEWMCDYYEHTRERRQALAGIGGSYEFVSLKKLAAKYGYSYGYVRKVASREKWRRDKNAFIRELRRQIEEKTLQMLERL